MASSSSCSGYRIDPGRLLTLHSQTCYVVDMTTTWTTKQADFPYLTATSQAEIIAADHAEALMMDTARGMVIVTITASGLRITRDMLDAEIRSARAPRPVTSHGYFPRSVTEMV
jgi:hypothetical protein